MARSWACQWETNNYGLLAAEGHLLPENSQVPDCFSLGGNSLLLLPCETEGSEPSFRE
jgi:hypothetical protein